MEGTGAEIRLSIRKQDFITLRSSLFKRLLCRDSQNRPQQGESYLENAGSRFTGG